MSGRAGIGAGRCLAIVDPLPCRICIGEPPARAVSTRVPGHHRLPGARSMRRHAVVEAETHCVPRGQLDVRLSNSDAATGGKQRARKRGRALLLDTLSEAIGVVAQKQVHVVAHVAMLAVCSGLGRRRLGGLPSILQSATTRGEGLIEPCSRSPVPRHLGPPMPLRG